ncbi:MAG TPA: hypothetical protein VFT43_04600 [Candidatus Polarisedimenticolia bacterium]|nr:hypothetical protein [Candidatus Polarisedimenticolia bacterium]
MRIKSFNERASALVAALGLAGMLASCATLEKNPNVAGTFSDKLSPYNYKDEGDLVLMVVGVEAARFIRKEPYFPLFVQIANKTKGTFSINRESFTLEDSLGRQYPMAPARDVAEKYPRIDLDRALFRQNRSITTTGADVYNFISSNFFPTTSGRGLLIEQVSLPPFNYMEDILYFPIPESGLNGVPLRLLFKVQSLEEPIMVRFEVPKTLGIFEKEEGAKQ